MSSDYNSFEKRLTRKSVHFNITGEAHSALRIACFQRKLSMQEVFEEVCQRIISEDPVTIRMLDQIRDAKKNKIIKKLSKQDAESLFDVIASNNPLSKDKDL